MGEEGVLKQAFEEAARIAAVVPEPLRVVAFQRALDEVLGGSERSAGRKRPSGGSSTKRKQPSKETSQEDIPIEGLVARINRTEHEITDSMPVLQRSLAMLKIAKDLGVDGLSAPRIAQILTEKFRVKTYRQHVSEQLSGATKLVDREKEGRGFTYRIMAAGEQLLSESTEGKKAKTATAASKVPSSKKQRRARGKKADSKEKTAENRRKGTRSRPGPKTAINTLIEAGFFSEARSMGEIQDRLRTKFGHVYKPTDLSPALGRLLRDGKLDRDRNENGKFEYQQP